MPQPSVFTIEEANSRIPWLQVVREDIVALPDVLHERRARLEELHRLAAQTAGDAPHADEAQEMQIAMERDRQKFQKFEQELRQEDVRTVDRFTGTVEIRCRIDDCLIWLNWQPGESEFLHWRADGDDRMMRRPLLEAVGNSGGGFAEDVRSDS